MSIDTVTKEEWDKTFKETITQVEKNIKNYMTTYVKLLTLRSNYRQDYKNNRIIHQLDYTEGLILYKKGASKKIGFQRSNKNDK